MLLSVIDRIMILGLRTLPQFGNVITLRIVNDLLKTVGFTEEEINEWDITTNPDEARVTWSPSKVKEVEIDITPGMVKILVESMEKTNELPIQALPLYDRLKEMLPCPKPLQP
jgi:hypothetical protein